MYTKIKPLNSYLLALMLLFLLFPIEEVRTAGLPATAPWQVDLIHREAGKKLGTHISVAFDELNDIPYVSYYDETNEDLMLAHPVTSNGNCGPDNTWKCQRLDTEGDVGKYSSIDIFDQGTLGTQKIGIAYIDSTNHDLKVAIREWNGLFHGWKFSNVGYDEGMSTSYSERGQTSLKFDSTGRVHVGYGVSYRSQYLQDSEDLAYVKYVGSGGKCGKGDAKGKWECHVLDTLNDQSTIAYSNSLELTSNDNPILATAFIQRDLLGLNTVEHGIRILLIDGSKRTYFFNSGDYPSLAVDQNDSFHLAFYQDNKLRYAKYTGANGDCGETGTSPHENHFTCDDIETITQIAPTDDIGISIAMDNGDQPVIAYRSDADPQGYPLLKVARPARSLGLIQGNCGPLGGFLSLWQCDTIDDGGLGGGYVYLADYVSLSFNQEGLAYIAYSQEDDYYNEVYLKLAYQEATTTFPWTIFLPAIIKGSGR